MGKSAFTRRASRALAPAILAAGLCLPGGAAASGFSVNCQILDPVTGSPREVFAPGESLRLSLQVEVPPGTEGKEVDVKLNARIRVAGIVIPYTLDEFKVSIPNEDPGQSGDPANVPIQDGVYSTDTIQDIAPDMPEGSVQLRVKASIADFGKDTCKLNIEIAEPEV